MKSVLITFDQAYYERIMALLDRLNCRGFYIFGKRCRDVVQRQVIRTSAAMPGLACVLLSLTVVDDNKVDPLLDTLHKMDLQTEQLGLRAFVWNIERTIQRSYCE